MSEVKEFKRSNVAHQSFAKGSVDVDNRTIKNVVLVQEGEAKGHGVFLDAKFVRRIGKLGREFEEANPLGLKSRFGHPSMSEDAIGTEVGRFRNFRTRTVDGNVETYADLHLLSENVLKNSKFGADIGEWIINMAIEAPDMFGNSIVFRSGGTESREVENSAGEMVERYFELPPESFLASDLVDDGAATESLFSNNLYSAQVSKFLDSNPDILKYIKQLDDTGNLGKVKSFLERDESNKERKQQAEKADNSINMSEIDTNLEKSIEEKVEEKAVGFFAKLGLDSLFSKKAEEEKSPKSETELLEEQYSAKFSEVVTEFNSLKVKHEELESKYSSEVEAHNILKDDYGKLTRGEATGVELDQKADPTLNIQGESELSEKEQKAKAFTEAAKKTLGIK